MKSLEIIIADDHALFVSGLELLLKETAGIEVTEIADDGKKLLQLLSQQQPDLVLLDINMPNMNGLDALKHIKARWPEIKVIILSTYHEQHIIDMAKQYSANGYLLKNCDKQELIDTIYAVADDKTSFPISAPKSETGFINSDKFLMKFNLTRREIEVAEFIKEGFTNQEIAEKLFLSVYTVDTHRKNIMQKLQLKKPAALIRFLLEVSRTT